MPIICQPDSTTTCFSTKDLEMAPPPSSCPVFFSFLNDKETEEKILPPMLNSAYNYTMNVLLLSHNCLCWPPHHADFSVFLHLDFTLIEKKMSTMFFPYGRERELEPMCRRRLKRA